MSRRILASGRASRYGAQEMTCRDCGSIDHEASRLRRYCDACRRLRRLATYRRYRARRKRLEKPLRGAFRPGSPQHWNTLAACEVSGCGRSIRLAGLGGHLARVHRFTLRDLHRRYPRMAAKIVASYPSLHYRQRINAEGARHRASVREARNAAANFPPESVTA